MHIFFSTFTKRSIKIGVLFVGKPTQNIVVYSADAALASPNFQRTVQHQKAHIGTPRQLMGGIVPETKTASIGDVVSVPEGVQKTGKINVNTP